MQAIITKVYFQQNRFLKEKDEKLNELTIMNFRRLKKKNSHRWKYGSLFEQIRNVKKDKSFDYLNFENALEEAKRRMK